MSDTETLTVNPRLTLHDWGWSLVVALVAMLVRLPGCFKGFWIDEYYTLRAARLNCADLIVDRLNIGHFPFYFIYAKLGLLLGDAEWTLRLTSLLTLGVAIMLLTGLMGELNLRRYLPLTWVMAIFQPYWVTVATDYRYMMPLVAMTIAASWACLAYARRISRPRVALMVLTALLLVMIHPVGLFIILALVGFLIHEQVIRRGGWSRRVFSNPLPLLAAVLPMIPALWLIRHSDLLTRPPTFPSWRTRLVDLLEVSLGYTYFWDDWMDHARFSFSDSLMPVSMTLVLLLSGWFARRELLRQGREQAWRFILALLLLFPGAYLFFSSLIVDIQGASRYWCILSLPTLILMALAWHATLPRRWLWAWRSLLIFVVGMQFVACLLDRGDLQREAAQWIMRQHGSTDQILVARGGAFLDVFHYLGFKETGRIEILNTAERQPEAIGRDLADELRQHPRLLVLLYRPKAPMRQALAEATRLDSLAGVRFWKLNEVTSVAALAHAKDDLPWLQSLPQLERPWGPSCGDN